MFNWLGISAVNPLLLWGSAAVAAPIIIHLLSKRRFRIVEWAAMEFLLDADRRNRRRIRLEHLLLLLLRCLAVLLIAFLVARPFLQPTGLAALAMQQVRTERIVVLDDSASMAALNGPRTVMEQATAALEQFVRATAEQRPGDTLTLVLSSRPDRPLINGRYFEDAEPMISAIGSITPSDLGADLADAALAVEQSIDEAEATGAGALNRVVYFVTDLRQRDWIEDPQTADDRTLERVLTRLGEKSDGVVLVDVGPAMTPNLSIASIEPSEKTITAGVQTRYDVQVVNHGTQEATDVAVAFMAEDAPAMEGFIERIPPGGQAVAGFSFTFREPGSRTITAELAPDALVVDNRRHFAAQVGQGVRVLIVDGHPSARASAAESFYLDRALSPPGDSLSGNTVDVISENQFSGVDLSRYDLLFLCNVYQAPAGQLSQVRQWVEAGGALVIAPGDQVDAAVYNQQLHRDGAGLMPLRLIQLAGDLTERSWVHLSSADDNHPVMKVFSGGANPFARQVKFFRYWVGEAPEELLSEGRARVLARFTDDAGSPAIVESSVGRGRVVTLAVPLDADWSNWPSDPSYVVTALELVRYLSPSRTEAGNLTVGSPLVWPLDVSRFNPEATLTVPGEGDPLTLAATAVAPAPPPTIPPDGPSDSPGPEAPAGGQDAELVLRLDRTMVAGVYDLELERYDGPTSTVKLAVNIDANEGDLTPAATGPIRQAFDQTNVRLVEGAAFLAGGVGGGRAELWRGLLVALIVVLCAEQFLAWTFGRRR